MIDFETVGDLLRKNKIEHRTMMKDRPIIALPSNDNHDVYFIFDRQGNLVEVAVVH